MKTSILFAIATAVSFSQATMAQTRSAKTILENSIVENNSSQSFDAKGFAVALMLASGGKKVVIKDASELSLHSTLYTKVPGTSSALIHLVKVKLSVISDTGECIGAGTVYIGKDNNNTQIASIRTSGPYSFSWKGQTCNVPQSTNSPVVFQSETERLTYESLAK